MNLRARNKTISRDLTKIEKRLSKRLETFYNLHIKSSLTPVQILKQKYDKQLRNLLSAFIFESYMIAVKHIQNNHPNLELSLSQIDMDNMQRLTDEQAEAFWKTASRLKERQILVETEIEFKNRMASLGLFDSIAAFIGQAAQTVFKAFNTGIKSTVSQVSNAFDVGDIDIDQAFKPVSGKVKFMTAGDAKVDPVFCEPLDGNIYNADDPDIPEPPLHLHCRCRLVPLLENE